MTNKRPDLTLILPAYNERASIAGTIRDARAFFVSRGLHCEIIVAADGCDGTRETVRDLAATNPDLKVIGHPERLGKGRGIREAMQLATGRIVGYADADNKVPIDEYGKIEPWLADGFDVVTGCRALSDSKIERPQPLYRRIGSKGFHLFVQTVIGLPGIHDTQCGFKFFRAEVARHLFNCQKIDGYMFDVEILGLAQWFGYRVKEVPIRWHDDADSRLQLVRGNIRNVVDIFRIRLSFGRHERAPAAVQAAASDD